jgi:CDP-glucose 4,6-dehydratase
LNGKKPTIRSDGKMVRDYFYVKDAVLAYMLLAENLIDIDINPTAYPNPTTYNFSYGHPKSVLEIVAEIQKLMPGGGTPTILNEATNEIQEQYLDSSRAVLLLGWRPKWTLEEALKETIQWYKENL